MKKIFTFIAAVICAINSEAKDYKDSLVINVGGVVTEQSAVVALTQSANNHYTFTLKNLSLNLSGSLMGVGTIVVDDLESFDASGNTMLQTSRNITLQDGDIASPSGSWIGSALGPVPINLTAKISENKIYASISINMPGLPIDVTFGSGYQLPNSGFELFHKDGTFDAPNTWHSFGTAIGSLASMVTGNKNTQVCDETRPGSTGKHSALITSNKIFWVVANGTMTTGRMVADAFSASDPGNHAEIDPSSTERDTNGDPFYATIAGKPDSLAVCVKFIQGRANASHPYATVSAAITDGTKYQDPEDKTYNNIMAKAKNNKIETKGGNWQRIVIPYEYVNRSIDGKTMLITISTNADPGQGSGSDKLYVDDMELIYNAGIASSTISGSTINVTPQGEGAFTRTVYGQKNGKNIATVTVFSDDLKKQTTQEFELPTSNGISTVQEDAAGTEEIFTLSGQKVSNMQPGQTYIVKKGSKVTKVINP